MKKISIIAVLLTMNMIGMAHADHHNWTGYYAGVNAGAAFNDAKLRSQQLGFTRPSEACDVNADYSTVSSGLQVGYLQQFSNDFVSGIEANAGINASQNHVFSCSSQFDPSVNDRFTFRNQLQTSIKGRLGHALDAHQNILPYLTAGASFAKFALAYGNEGGDYYSTTAMQLGWLIGAGVEWAFMPQWSLRAEYYFVDYGQAIKLQIPSVYGLDDPDGNGKVRLSSNNFMISVNYWV